MQRTLVAAVRAAGVETLERRQAVDLVVRAGVQRGLLVLDPTGNLVELEARDVVLASGGHAALFAVTTNPAGATGDGTAMALRAGVPVADVELVQFHPTALAVDAWPRPLLSEALRGAGAVLRDATGRRFVDELAPRDVVSRAIAAELVRSGSEHVFLDATGIDRFADRFPSLAGVLAAAGLDASGDWIPVAPAAHYCCGGVLTDLDGATALAGLWAVGEAACTGAQGANRLASNSLLEGLVFGGRAAEAIVRRVSGDAGDEVRHRPGRRGALGALLDGAEGEAIPVRRLELDPPWAAPPRARAAAPRAGGAQVSPAALRRDLQGLFSRCAGIVRSGAGLAEAAGELRTIATRLPEPDDPRDVELANLALTGAALIASAAARHETRGAHTRADYPATDDVRFRCRFSPTATAIRPLVALPAGPARGGRP